MKDALQALESRFQEEAYAQIFGIRIVELEPGKAVVKMEADERMSNIFDSIHGAAIFSLIDSAFELTVNSHGTVAVALSVNVSYLNAARAGATLFAEGRELNMSRKISACEIRVTDEAGRLIATASALAYRKADPLPFL